MTNNKTKKDAEEPKEKFEDGLSRLETIVRQLESGSAGLEQSLKLFEDGVGLSKQLHERLQGVKHRVEVLTEQGKGDFKVQPLEEE